MNTLELRGVLLKRRKKASEDIQNDCYNIVHYLDRAGIYQGLGYPDLAAGDAYKALLLWDEITDESGEYHEQARTAFEITGQEISQLQHSVYRLLVQNLLRCECFQSAYQYAKQWERASKQDSVKPSTDDVLNRYKTVNSISSKMAVDANDLTDITLVRREIYPWNSLEPSRNSEQYVQSLNNQLQGIASKCEVRVAELPILTGGTGTMKQLGLFAKENIEPGEVVLDEKSILTANNNLHDSLCDACSSELPPLGQDTQLFSCPDCDDIIFCSQTCLDDAMELYHPAVCGHDVDSIARDAEAKEASDALYFLLLARAIAMAETQGVHTLELKQVSSLWGDFNAIPDDFSEAKKSLPFSFRYNVLYPIHLLIQMDLDIFATTAKYDFWILNTLYAKFRGVASGRPNRRTGKPEVCAVHPLWCLANHSCEPNVTWEWSGEIKLVARTKEQIVRWGPAASDGSQWTGSIKAGEEIMNHYCDVDLDVVARREWAQGPLGGDCMCKRCIWEADTLQKSDTDIWDSLTEEDFKTEEWYRNEVKSPELANLSLGKDTNVQQI